VELTVRTKLVLNKENLTRINFILSEYIKTVNDIFKLMVLEDKKLRLSSKDIEAVLPSAVKNQAIRDAKSLYTRFKKTKRQCVLKKEVCIWNNQNYKIKDDYLYFPVIVNERSKRIKIKLLLTNYQRKLLEGKLGTLRITKKSKKLIAQIAVRVKRKTAKGNKTMGVDLGLKIPAVAVIEDGETRFLGNGRQNKYVRRKNKEYRRKLGINKKVGVIKRNKDKEKRWMSDKDHKISREIVNFAKEKNVSVIRLEKLANIRNTARTSRKNAKNLHTWSFYRLAFFIEYKANLEGIGVEYVNPKNTSKLCPRCKILNVAKDRKYGCSCGFKTHRDRVGAMNIIHATVVGGLA